MKIYYGGRHAATRTYDREPACPYKSMEMGKKNNKESYLLGYNAV
jgi:hypothetical protein